MHMTINKKSLARTLIAALACTVALVASASARAADSIELELPLGASQLQRSVEAVVAHGDYQAAYRKARKLEVAPKRSGLSRGLATAGLRGQTAELKQRIRKARRQARIPRPESLGVSSATLEAIASCESGGSPTVVSSNGSYRGKYQFSYGTWAGVGGSGDPAAASEAEQDYRAALLYARSASSPWPVCG